MIGHLIHTDAKRFRWLLLAWCALLATHTAMLLLAPDIVTDLVRYRRVDVTVTLLGVILVLATVVMTATIIQGDTPIGTDAFWLTRPIGPLQLLAAKAALLCAVLVALPVIVEAAVMAASHMPLSSIVRVVTASATSGLFWLALFMATGAITRSLGALALFWIGAIIVVVVGLFVANALTDGGPPANGGMTAVVLDPGRTMTAWAIWTGGLILTFALTLVVQYRGRNRVLAVGTCVLAGLAALLIAAFAPWRVLDPVSPTPPQWTSRPGAARLTASAGRGFIDAANMPRGSVALPLRLEGVEPGWMARASLADATLTAAGRTWRSTDPHMTIDLPRENSDVPPYSAALQDALSVRRVIEPATSAATTQNVISFEFPEGEPPPTLPATVTYTGSFAISLSHAQVAGTLPLSRGASVQDDAYRLRIDDVEFWRGEIVVRVTEAATASGDDQARQLRRELFAVNDDRSEAIEIVLVTDDLSSLPFSAHLPLFSTKFSRMGLASHWFGSNRPGVRPETLLDASWMNGAHLALVLWTSAGSIERELTIPNLSICAHGPPGC